MVMVVVVVGHAFRHDSLGAGGSADRREARGSAPVCTQQAPWLLVRFQPIFVSGVFSPPPPPPHPILHLPPDPGSVHIPVWSEPRMRRLCCAGLHPWPTPRTAGWGEPQGGVSPGMG